ncbi:MAG: hypothetical protein COW24_00965 [Candidatus Kerfeldbacteria bacterium CG15_BIG_FIL_POST_REV_8_21_14_020_45_12]|uniref:ATP-grasp fold RimK-type domain-containing protein n=1 Tax=Candidatus Kerfeldbacteria bacterium CG15_BIG_FIL_POST_REV_8_21_14_020_45_12 TaxID=2014247 RepID=A0A2M7H4U6_9BACT|nr:MAG: hypothetical protein COW24_00965 [Candidatus Kerfeldbacteria bacterium CG15_BIG_FIL_POST_REV_8_21_14_020_45_12]PJA93775.1 MAG: hypothetical protein CO132_01450 [Candidatus Kerfeldbacteria bacterium CG_4_9_14_3_um_filter_45_8]
MANLPIEEFDVIVVYDGTTVKGASDKSYRGRTPFPKPSASFSYNKSYEYFLKQCKRSGLRAAFASTSDITAGGLFQSVWVYQKNWKRVHGLSNARIVFDKFSHLDTYNAKYDAKLKNKIDGVQYFHNPGIRALFDDKLRTYGRFSDFAIPTVKIDLKSSSTISFAKKALLDQIQAHKHMVDFTRLFVLKDQFGAGGVDVHKVKRMVDFLDIGKRDELVSYILQPLIIANGFDFFNQKGYVDLRVIVCGGQITSCYIRTAKPGEFRANASRGGSVDYIEKKQIPKDVISMSKSINDLLPVQDGFYALDFIKSSTGNLYFIEGNITPGLNWFNAKDERQVKQFMRSIVSQISLMAAD